jgi:LDH2 family malate/lactate/ureidoglycolate dehydrogenase
MNEPPVDFITVREDPLLAFATACLETVGLETEHAALVSRLLVDSDLRGVRSHGTKLLNKYCREHEQGELNPMPQIEVVHETPTAAVVNADGALGYLPTVRATELAIEKAKEVGIGMGLTQGIGHYGSAGHYVRLCMDAGCIGFSVQGPEGYGDYHLSSKNSEQKPSLGIFGWPPFCFGMPAGNEPAVVLDAGAPVMAGNFNDGDFEEIMGKIPAAVFKGVGLSAVANLLGAGLTGINVPEVRQLRERWREAKSGSMVLAIHIGSVVPEEVFHAESDQMVREVRDLYEPVPGFDRSLMPGAIEEETMQLHLREGIRYGDIEQQETRKVGERLGIGLPWE